MAQSAPHDANRNAAIGGKSTLTGEFITPYVDPSTGRLYVDPGTITDSQYITEIDYVSGTNPIYLGNATPGSATSASAWQIRKLTYDGNNNVVSILFAGGTSAYTAIWDNRASLTYS